jgi:short-subunit dehydrogenase
MASGDDFSTTFGPWALVTGASSGIGKEFARQLALRGLNVVLAARRKTLLDNLADDLRQKFNIETRTVVVDLSHNGVVEPLARALAGLDIGLVISNAGTGDPGRLLEPDHEEQLARLRLTALSHFDIAHVFGKRLTLRGRGGMVLAGTMGAINGIPYMAIDAAAKAFVQSLGESLHIEFGRSGIRVMTLIVPSTDTTITAKFGFDPASMPMKPMSARGCVTEALQAFEGNQSSSFPGAVNRSMNGIVPSSLKRAMMAQMIERAISQRSDRLTQPKPLQNCH